MTRQQSNWLRYSNIVPIIFTFISIIVVLSGFFFTMDNKLNTVLVRLDAIDRKYEELSALNHAQDLEIQRIKLSDDSAKLNFTPR